MRAVWSVLARLIARMLQHATVSEAAPNAGDAMSEGAAAPSPSRWSSRDCVIVIPGDVGLSHRSEQGVRAIPVLQEFVPALSVVLDQLHDGAVLVADELVLAVAQVIPRACADNRTFDGSEVKLGRHLAR